MEKKIEQLTEEARAKMAKKDKKGEQASLYTSTFPATFFVQKLTHLS